VRGIKNLVCPGLVLLLVLASAAPVFAANSFTEREVVQSIDRAVEYFHSIQNEDGGFPGKAGRPSSIGATCWAVMALIAAGEDVNSSDWVLSGSSPYDFLNNYEEPLDETTEYARMLLTLTVGGQGVMYMVLII